MGASGGSGVSDPQPWVEVGRIGRPYGLRGWVHVESWMDPPDGLLAFRDWRLVRPGAAPGSGVVAEARQHGQGFVARLEGSTTPEQAAGFVGAVIEVSRSVLPALGEREIYQSDLVGYAVRNLEGDDLGVIDHILDTPAHPVLVLAGERERLVPLTPLHLQRVDRAARVAWVDWPADF
jgi:16S rRNA processing protein RimM